MYKMYNHLGFSSLNHVSIENNSWHYIHDLHKFKVTVKSPVGGKQYITVGQDKTSTNTKPCFVIYAFVFHWFYRH